MNLKQFAEMLNGRECRNEMTREENQLAKELGFVVVYGYSDDSTILEGAISDEVGCYGGGTIYIDENKVFEDCECDCRYSRIAKEKCKTIDVIYENQDYFWEYETDIPHETFDILYNRKNYCKGIIFDIKSLIEV